MERRIKELPGTWSVESVETQKGKITESGFSPFEQPQISLGDQGIFDFGKSEVTYSYIADDSLYLGRGPYSVNKNQNSSKIIFNSSDHSMSLPPEDRSWEMIFNNSGSQIRLILYTVFEDRVDMALTLTLRRSN